jgi:glycosyltransferase involved in cell wall biosynthesis
MRSAILGSTPDVVISFVHQVNVLTLLAIRFTSIPVVISERVDPRQHRIAHVWEWLRSWSYPYAAMLVVQTDEIFEWAASKVGFEKSIVIPNPVAREQAGKPESRELFPPPFVLAVGRLTRQKGIDLLMPAFGKVCHQYPEWSLVILGEGGERASLGAMARKLGIEARVHMPGRHANPGAVMSRASLFVLPSRYEGFPNALLEAMSYGLPVISFDCRSGPRDIIRDGVDGVLVPSEDVDALANAILDLVQDPDRRERYGRRALEVAERFSVERVMGLWEELLLRITEKDGR